jgi:LDH2 family malate/lactate/ureidoglycolate dehydrogenase
MSDSHDYVVMAEAPLTDFARKVLEAVDVPPEAAALVAESLVSANLRGVDSHGVQLLIWYTQQIRDQSVDVKGTGRVVSESGSCMVYDAMQSLGQVVSDIACNHAARMARANGIGIVTVRESSHFGACAWWAEKLAAEGFIGIVMCNATPLVAAWQGKDQILGTNPICMAVPGPHTYLLDMATTTVALNRIHKAVLSGDTEIPPGWAMDADGNPTTDPQVALKGLPTPVGGYKGTGLSLMVEILCAVLSGGAMMTEVGGLRASKRPMRVSQFFLAIDPARFLPIDEFESRMQTMREKVTGSRPAVGFHEVLIAGEPEWRSEAQRKRDGIPVAKGIWEELTKLAESLRVPIPV